MHAALSRRAVRSERRSDLKRYPWDRAVSVALAGRARVELLRSGAIAVAQQDRVLEQAREAAEIALSYEARGARGVPFCAKVGCGHARGWGTSLGISVGDSQWDTALDAYSTAIVLNSVGEVAALELSRAGPSRAVPLARAMREVLEDWLEHHSVELAGGGGRSFDKVVSRDPAVRRVATFNTDALMARALLLLSDVEAGLGSAHATASRQALQVAEPIAKRLERAVVQRVLGAAEAERGMAWRHGWFIGKGGALSDQRVEDFNHASFVLDFLALAAERPSGPPLVEPAQVRRLADLLPALAFVRGEGRRVAHRLYVASGDLRRNGPRGKLTLKGFGLSPDAERSTEVVSWWKQLGGKWRSIDMGLSIRTSWGWSRALRGQVGPLRELGAYLELVRQEPQAMRSANVFLASAAWWRAMAPDCL